MEPRLKWNKIVLAAKTILFRLRRDSMLKWNYNFKDRPKYILTWNHGLIMKLDRCRVAWQPSMTSKWEEDSTAAQMDMSEVYRAAEIQTKLTAY